MGSFSHRFCSKFEDYQLIFMSSLLQMIRSAIYATSMQEREVHGKIRS